MTDPHILVASTLAAYKALPGRPVAESEAWLTHAERWRADLGVEFFAALQVGQGHDEAFTGLLLHLGHLGADVWRFSVDDGEPSVTTGNRLAGIITGRNLIHEYMVRRPSFTHLLLLDSDVEPPPDAITKLLEVRWPIVAGHIPTYALDGPRLWYEQIDDGPYSQLRGSAHDGPWNKPTMTLRFGPDADIREHWSSAGCWMLTRNAANRIRWGWSQDDGQTDDPWTADLALRVGLGPQWTRHDVVCMHHPPVIGPVELRGHTLEIIRGAP